MDVTFVQIENYLKANEKSHFLELCDKHYIMEINKLRAGLEESVKLPSPISAPFSQGERQIYIMSLYLALLKTSRKDIPFFIDTPFARIDSNHRAKIVNEFFRGITNQTFILSTDEEIVGPYKDALSDIVSDKFMLCIDSYGKTVVKKNCYFEDWLPMVFKLKTSKETMKIFEELSLSIKLQPFALAKLALALSIRDGEQLTQSDFMTDSEGLELNRQTITGEYDELFKALIIKCINYFIQCTHESKNT